MKLLEEDAVKNLLKIFLKYVDGESVIHEIKRVSKPGRRVYEGSEILNQLLVSLGISIVTTNKGVMTDKQAKEFVVGGEIICTVW